MTKCKGKWAVITGATNAIGRALCNKCAHLCINMVLIDMDESVLSSTKSQLLCQYPSVCVLHYKCDISNEQLVKQMIIQLKKDYCVTFQSKIVIHFLFNNAEIVSFDNANILNGDLKAMHQMMDVNLFGMIYITQSFLPFLQTNHDDDRFIVNTCSMSGVGCADSLHAITKHGVRALSETFDCELKQYNKECKAQPNGRGVIHVSCLIPSYVQSSILNQTDNVRNVLHQLNKNKTYNCDRAHPEAWSKYGINASIVADIVFKEAIEMKQFWIYTHREWSKCVMMDQYYSVYTQKFNQHHETKKVFAKYKQNLQRIIEKSKL